jgi:DNA-binding transcriptional regulator YhcF (GntR family)
VAGGAVSGTPRLEVVTTDPTPPYEQLRRQLAELIEAGVLAPGDRLPPLRQLAADLGLAVGTVARTYRELEAADLVSSRRGGGTRVRAGTARAVSPQRALERHAEAFVRQARLLGAADDAVRAALESALTGQPAGPRQATARS